MLEELLIQSKIPESSPTARERGREGAESVQGGRQTLQVPKETSRQGPASPTSSATWTPSQLQLPSAHGAMDACGQVPGRL